MFLIGLNHRRILSVKRHQILWFILVLVLFNEDTYYVSRIKRKRQWEVGVGMKVGVEESGVIRLAKSTLFYGTGMLTELRESLSTQIGGLNEKSSSTCKDIAAITPYCLSSAHTSVVISYYA